MVKDNHLGGFVDGGDIRTYYPDLWDKLIKNFNVTSLLDIGCGQGHSTKYFKDKGVGNIIAIDGSVKAIQGAVYSPIWIHDYTNGPLDFMDTFDLAWCCEFVEHIEEKYIPNYFQTLSCAKVIAMTHATKGQGGYHHVNEQSNEYWIKKFDTLGYRLIENNQEYRDIAHDYFQKTGMIFVRKESEL